MSEGTVLVRVANELIGDLSTWSPPHRVMIAPDPHEGATHQMYFQTFTPDGETSDGFHTFNELYRHRLLLSAALWNAWHRLDGEGIGDVVQICKSRLHHDWSEPFGGGWFIVSAQLPTGQISYHYELKDWELFRVTELERAPEWDGHTAAEAADRLEQYLA